MDERDQPTGPSQRDKLRDRIFQQRLWIEELRRTADREALRSAITDLQRMTREVGRAEESNAKRRLK